MSTRNRLGVAGLALLVSLPVAAQEPVRLFAAGSLRAVMTEIGQAYAKAGGGPVQGEFGPSGLLRDRLAKGSAPRRLCVGKHGASGLAPCDGPLRTGHAVCPQSAVRAGCSRRARDHRLPARPHARSGGKARHLDAEGGSLGRLRTRALREGRDTEGGSARHARGQGAEADRRPRFRPRRRRTAASTACSWPSAGPTSSSPTARTRRRLATRILRSRSSPVPAPLAVGANYGLTVLADAKPAATQFAQFVLSADGQRILARHGFDAP